MLLEGRKLKNDRLSWLNMSSSRSNKICDWLVLRQGGGVNTWSLMSLSLRVGRCVRRNDQCQSFCSFFLFRSGLQLLTSSASHGHSGEAGESRVVERCVSRLVRSGRDRDAAILSGLHSKLSACSKDILRNRASILTLLYSLSDEASGNKENQVIP